MIHSKHSERLEGRLLFSAYALQTLAAIRPTANGNEPFDTPLLMDPSGNLFGTTASGGPNGAGTVFEIAHDTRQLSVLATFDGSNHGGRPRGHLALDADGDLFGAASVGGPTGDGTLFELPRGSHTIVTLASFNGTNGTFPTGVTRDNDGNLYGTTLAGGSDLMYSGAHGPGTVFELVQGSHTITTRATFNGDNGGLPYATVVLDAEGNLYGTTETGGPGTGKDPYGGNGYGTVFEVVRGSHTITTLFAFADVGTGAEPRCALVTDAEGNLYGTTTNGGYKLVGGTIFEIPRATGKLVTLATFHQYVNGDTPNELTIDARGNLFGTTAGFYSSISTIFELPRGSGTIMTLGHPAGQTSAGVTLDAAGNLFGAAQLRGSFQQGFVFELAHGNPVTVSVAQFNDGSVTSNVGPAAGLVQDAQGDLFGTTVGGGSNGEGSIFEILHGTGRFLTLASFTGLNGAQPQSTLTIDRDGNLFGTTDAGGASNAGTVFELARGSAVPTTLVSFDHHPDSTFATFHGSLLLDASGNLFGTVPGDYGHQGMVFEVLAGTGRLIPLASFASTRDGGASPNGGLVIDAAGDIFGTTAGGGANRSGTIFELPAGTSAPVTLASFNDATGYAVQATLTLDAAGNLFGTTDVGGSTDPAVHDNGTVFELARGSHTIATLARFTAVSGVHPAGTLAIDPAGNLYGATTAGGAHDDGTLFRVARGGRALTVLHAFSGADGANPIGGLLLGMDGALYGTTSLGGPAASGTVFRVTLPPPPVVTVSALTLIDADTGRAVLRLTDGATLDLAKVPRHLNVVATLSGGGDPVGSVLFGLDSIARYRVELGAPYALFGDLRGRYLPGTFRPGTHALSARAFAHTDATLPLGPATVIHLKVIDSRIAP